MRGYRNGPSGRYANSLNVSSCLREKGDARCRHAENSRDWRRAFIRLPWVGEFPGQLRKAFGNVRCDLMLSSAARRREMTLHFVGGDEFELGRIRIGFGANRAHGNCEPSVSGDRKTISLAGDHQTWPVKIQQGPNPIRDGGSPRALLSAKPTDAPIQPLCGLDSRSARYYS